ncbi:hypothetical protein KGF56_003778 [Candida oxycetoniae]|uniref:Uncharacterized protein n=1 Tax=Candida oxycetoniae TaxID=497107 RepID=A0AAI9SVI7_9ASCO|nr:uncharacterized protein KGF56_003778 [Candida oxycetoniae]KAI3403494.2 hypothetical protein KGF56_003778 [Candida oxycetoniae]
MLPCQRVYQENVLKKSLPSSSPSSSSSSSSPAKENKEKLKVTDYNVQLDYQLSSKEDVVVAINTILTNRWSESTELHDKYRLNHLKGTSLEEVIFQIKNLSSSSKAELVTFRQSLPSGVVTVTQLYSIFHTQGNTFVDKSLELSIRRGIVRKFIISNASPVISRSLNAFQSKKVTYGFENVEIVALSKHFDKVIEESVNAMKAKNDEEARGVVSSLEKFHDFVRLNPQEMFISSFHFTEADISNLMRLGYITLTSNHFNEQESHYSIAYPGCGTFLKLVNECKIWLVKALNKTKYKELLEDELFRRWSGVNPEGDPKLNNFRKPYFGYDLHWVLADALGCGIIEVFNTPVGRGWRLTGKL